MSSDTQTNDDKQLNQSTLKEVRIAKRSLIDENKASLGAWTLLLAVDWAAASLFDESCHNSTWLLLALPLINVHLMVTAEYRSRWLETLRWALSLESKLATATKPLGTCRNQANAGLQAGESDAESLADTSDHSTASDHHAHTEDGDSETWSVVDKDEVLQRQDQDLAEPEQETQEPVQPVAAPAVRVTHGSVPSQDPLEWLASHIYLLLNRFLASDTNQSTHKHTEGPASEPEAASDASATTQTPFRTVLRTHQDFSEEEGLKLVLAKPEEYLWSLLTLIGHACIGSSQNDACFTCCLEAALVAIKLCYNWATGSSGVGWFVPLYPSVAGLCCTAVVLFVHASDCGFIQLPQPPSKGVRGPGTIVQRPSKDSAPQPNQLQSPSASHAEAQTVAESSIQSIPEATAESVVEATPQSVAVATPQSVADATAEAVAKATPQSGKEATLNATIKPNADSTTQPATASAVNIAAIVSDELKYELETHTKPHLVLPAGWKDKSNAAKSERLMFVKEFNEEYVTVVFTAPGHLQPECMKFKVSVEKESCDDALVFEVETNGNSIKVLKVILEDVDDVDNNFLIDSIEEEYYDDLTMVFSESNGRMGARMQQAFKTYLEEQGVNAELLRGLIDFSEKKTQTLSPQRDYIDWLLGVQKFLEQ